ncbi:MAG: alkaline phosphatase family protein [Bacteroidales bacterium]|jgi:predicted AlkP superfamily pyrophosphatase or phosphodiesterase|nr:alkaline phosphatase family protein [Bacteroidales bacterium]MCK9498608.1 alkaline phosphatase family protein [Bacteroidales bacterium]MDY0313646.1 alkaline phosphatase family protein [Bacteroidales bacterium]NLB86228.1 alkaline phosphatase family protein [Bacteroidales bacterium]
MKNTILLVISLIAFCSNLNSQIESIIPSDKPKLVVGIVVEQMRQDYLDKFWNNFGNKGFKKLAINGSYCQNANYEYSLTQTAPGYATIVTGCEPAEHGIVSNYWFNALTGNKEHCIETKSYKIIGGNSNNISYSPKNILTTTFSDEAKLFAQGKSKVISISLDPIGAVISGGYTADAAYWLDEKTGNWVSSNYYIDKLPDWVIEQNEREMPDEYLQREWIPLLEIENYNTSQADSSIYEYGLDMVYKTFPYKYQEITKSIKDYELLKMIPEGQTHLTDLAVAALYNEDLGKNKSTDFLFINYSVSENIGKLFGPQSIEVEDLFLRLDKDLGHLIDVLEEVVGKNNILIYLSSNHGVSENPDYLVDNKMPAGIFKQHYILSLLRSYLKALYGEGDWVLDYKNNQIYLNKTLIEDSQISLKEFQEKVIAFIINSSGISNAISSNQFQNIIFSQGMPKRMQNSYNQKRSGDIMISLKAGWIEDIPFVCDHNSGYKYDTNVPLIWYGWKVKKQNIYNYVNITSIAPTISKILNTPAPPASTGEVLNSVFNNK